MKVKTLIYSLLLVQNILAQTEVHPGGGTDEPQPKTISKNDKKPNGIVDPEMFSPKKCESILVGLEELQKQYVQNVGKTYSNARSFYELIETQSLEVMLEVLFKNSHAEIVRYPSCLNEGDQLDLLRKISIENEQLKRCQNFHELAIDQDKIKIMIIHYEK